METLLKLVNKIFSFDKDDTKIGLSQFKTQPQKQEPVGPSIKKKDVKLSDLMRRAS